MWAINVAFDQLIKTYTKIPQSGCPPSSHPSLNNPFCRFEKAEQRKKKYMEERGKKGYLKKGEMKEIHLMVLLPMRGQGLVTTISVMSLLEEEPCLDCVALQPRKCQRIFNICGRLS